MQTAWWLFTLTFVAGAVLPLQTGINGQLARHVGGAIPAAMLSFIVGTVVLITLTLALRQMPSVAAIKSAETWQLAGGLLGAFFLATAAMAGPRIGALLFIALVLAGQLTMAVLLDHFGWAGFRESPISPGKIAGLLLIIAGVWFIQRG
jgi:bacterial/archaeal transporter family-2 protein